MENKRGEIATFLTIATLVFIGIASLTSSLYNNSKTARTTTTKAAEGDGPGGTCVAGRGGADSKGCGGDDGCRVWEKCVDGGCRDTTNLGTQAPSADSCGSSPGTPVSNPDTNGKTGHSVSVDSVNNACNKPTCIYSQQDADGVHCYEGNRKDDTKDYGFNNNCVWIAGCSTGKRVDCPTGNSNTQGGGQSQTTGGSSSGTPGCFHMEGSANYTGNGKFDITIRFVSDGGDGDIQLERDNPRIHLAGWNRWNKGVSGNVWTWVPQWTGSPITVANNSTLSVTYLGYVANSAACPNGRGTLTCYLAVNKQGNGTGNCGGAPPSLPSNPAPTQSVSQGNKSGSSSSSEKPSKKPAEPPSSALDKSGEKTASSVSTGPKFQLLLPLIQSNANQTSQSQTAVTQEQIILPKCPTDLSQITDSCFNL